ncbi:MAG TPA: O-antigen ligase family protein [Elusimicrobiales bacterium]|nr:O-antigen ligase family protein [Elusimicrobiales bacterium]
MKKRSVDELIYLGLCLFAFSVIFSVTAVEAALFLIIFLLIARMRRENKLGELKRTLTGHPLFIPWMVYLGVCLLTSLTAYYPMKGLDQLNSDFLKYACLSTLFLAVRKDHLNTLSRVYIAAAALSAGIGIAQVFHLFPSVYDAASVRANGLMNAVRYGEVMVLALALALARVLSPRPTDSRRERFFYIAAAAAVFAALIFSQTRGAYLGFVVLITCLLIFGKGFRLKLLAATGLLLAVALIAAKVTPAISSRLTATATSSGTSANQYVAINTRKELWITGYKMFKAHPLVGVGPDNVKSLFLIFHPETIEDKVWGSLHSIYIHQAAERGIIGLGALLFLFWAMLTFALKRFRALPGPDTLWALCALPAFYAMNLTEISFQHVHTSFAIFLALAFSAAAEEGASN